MPITVTTFINIMQSSAKGEDYHLFHWILHPYWLSADYVLTLYYFVSENYIYYILQQLTCASIWILITQWILSKSLFEKENRSMHMNNNLHIVYKTDERVYQRSYFIHGSEPNDLVILNTIYTDQQNIHVWSLFIDTNFLSSFVSSIYQFHLWSNW